MGRCASGKGVFRVYADDSFVVSPFALVLESADFLVCGVCVRFRFLFFFGEGAGPSQQPRTPVTWWMVKCGSTLLEGNKGILYFSREVRLQLCVIILIMLRLRWRGRGFATLIGLWSYLCQAIGLGYQIMFKVYQMIEPHELEVRRYISSAVKLNFTLVPFLAPVSEQSESRDLPVDCFRRCQGGG